MAAVRVPKLKRAVLEVGLVEPSSIFGKVVGKMYRAGAC
jgi:hypothetical protein